MATTHNGEVVTLLIILAVAVAVAGTYFTVTKCNNLS